MKEKPILFGHHFITGIRMAFIVMFIPGFDFFPNAIVVMSAILIKRYLL